MIEPILNERNDYHDKTKPLATLAQLGETICF